MKSLVLVLALALPALALADDTVWKWRDGRGRLHYSNVKDATPQDATELKKTIGIVESEAPEQAPAVDLNRLEMIRTQRAIRKQLAEIDDYKKMVRARQYWRLLALYPNSYILSDWMVTDRWLAYEQTRAWLEKALDQLDRRAAGYNS